MGVNLKKAIHHFEIHAKHDEHSSHWNLACIYVSEEGYVNKDRALYHYRLAADLGNVEAKEVVGEYFVSISIPRRLTFRSDELEIFLKHIRKE